MSQFDGGAILCGQTADICCESHALADLKLAFFDVYCYPQCLEKGFQGLVLALL